MRSHLRSTAFALLCAPVPLSGCGWGAATLGPNATIPITASAEITTGAWTIVGDTAGPGSHGVGPIAGFTGALTATGTAVQGGFTIGSFDPSNPLQPAPCLGLANSYSNAALHVTGTASNGVLTLDSDFANSHLHLVAQLSSDRKTITSGSYVITGACATNSPFLEGNSNAPLTGIYKGQLYSASGSNPQATATLTQAPYYFGDGYIPVTGNITFATATCTTTMQLDGGFVIGYLNFLDGYTGTATYINGVPANNAYFLGEEDTPDSTVISNITWSFPDSGCGAESGNFYNSGQLVRQ